MRTPQDYLTLVEIEGLKAGDPVFFWFSLDLSWACPDDSTETGKGVVTDREGPFVEIQWGDFEPGDTSLFEVKDLHGRLVRSMS